MLREQSSHIDENYEYSELTSKIIGCAIEVHKTLGPGFEEVFYQRALHRELAAAGLDAAREVDIDVEYKGLTLGKKRVDFIVEQCLVEIKAKSVVADADVIQTVSYLKASGLPVGLLINFGGPKTWFKRFANTVGREEVQNR